MLFLIQNGQKFHPNFLLIWCFSIFVYSFSLRHFYYHYFVLVNVYVMQNIKNTPLKYQFLSFFTILDQIWPNFCPKDHTHFTFFAHFQWNMLEDSISINKLCCNSVVLKKSWLVKPLINCFIGPNLYKKGVIMGHTKNGKQLFLAGITKEDHHLQKKFFLLKYYKFWLNYDFFFYLAWCFLSKKFHFELKQLCCKLNQL